MMCVCVRCRTNPVGVEFDELECVIWANIHLGHFVTMLPETQMYCHGNMK